jgi:amino acid adenylation domain-containing protein/non-ribosomal peptide synthase protein (TIGR01720 family)
MLFHSLRDTGVGMYVNQVAYSMQNVDVQAMREAWSNLLNRYTILRTSFVWENLEQPEQCVHAQVDVPMLVEDWMRLTPSEQESKLRATLKDDREKGFDFHQAPLLRVYLFQLSYTDWYFIFSHHHLLLDGWSKNQLNMELRAFYEGARTGATPRLKPARPFRAYIDYLASRDVAEDENFWRDYLAGIRTVTPLPAELSATHRLGRKLRFGEWSLTISAEQKEQLLLVARQCRVTLNTLLLGAWGILMSRYVGETDVLFGMLVSGRPPDLEGVETMVGMFLNAMPVRVRIEESELFSTWIEKLQLEQSVLRQYEHTALRSIQEWCDIPRGMPIYECIVVNTNTLGTKASGQQQQPTPGAARRAMASSVQQNVPLHLDLETVGETLLFKMTFDARRFEQASITRLMEHLSALLEGIADNPARPVGDLPMMTPRERHQVLVEWNHTTASVPPVSGLHQLFEAQACQTPDAIAVRYREASLTYGELNTAANQLAHHLRAIGVQRESLVGIAIPRSIDMTIALLAVLKAGGAYVPLDPKYPRDRLSFMLQDSGSCLVLTTLDLREMFLNGPAAVICLDDTTTPWLQEAADNLAVPMDPGDLAYILYTSGSTGTPKGVAVSHRVSINRLHTEHDPFQPGEAFCSKTSLSFVDSIWELFSAWIHGSVVTLIPDEVLPDPERFVEALGQSEATRIVLVPSLLRNLLESDLDLANRLPHLKHWISSGEPLPADLCRQFSQRLPDRVLTNLYGTTEIWDATRCDSRDRPPGMPLPIGRPMGNVRVYILDPQLRPVPVGVAGELYVGGAGMALGYWNRPSLNEEKFIPDPFGSNQQRLYRTGDRTRWLPDGMIEHLGRLDQQFKLRGFRIEAGEIEETLRRHPGLVNAAIAVTSKDTFAAYVVPATDPGPSMEELRNFARIHLPEFMRPAQWVVLAKLPLTPSGKVDRRALASLPCEETREEAAEPVVGSLSPTETTVAEVWRGVLGLAQLGPLDNVFERGGHSLAATRAAFRLGKALGMQIPLKVVFENPSVKTLAHWIDSSKGTVVVVEELPEIQRAERGKEAPLSYSQRRLWFLDQLDPGSVSYTVPNTIEFRGELDVGKLEAALNEIVCRHESLRTTFLSSEGVPYQIIHESESVSIPVVDLSASPLAVSQSKARELAREQSRKSWDLQHGPLLRVQLIRLAKEHHLLVITMHHIITDGHSMAVFAREVGVLYRAFSNGRPSPLPLPPIHYADFARWQQDWLKGKFLETQLEYWRNQLADLPELEVPTDFPRPRTQRHQGDRELFTLSSETSVALDALGRALGATPFMVLLAGFETFLAISTNQKDVFVGTPVANRNRPELETVMGFFVNTLVMRIRLDGDPTFRDVVERTRKVCLESYDHQDVPFDMLVDTLQPVRDLSRHPLFQIMFVHQEGGQGVSLPGVSFRQQSSEMETSNFDLLLVTAEGELGYECKLQYNTDLYTKATAQRLASRLERLFQRFATHPDLPLSRIAPCTDQEQEQILDWSRGVQLPIQASFVQDWLRSHAQSTPNHLAAESADSQLTYGDLDRLSDAFAARLRILSVGPDIIVGLCVDKTPEMLIGLFGILKAGGAFLPIDPDYPDERIILMLEETASPVIVTQDHFVDRLSPLLGEQRLTVSLDDSASSSSDPLEQCRPVGTPANIAYVIFTSGSTGRPKGVLVEHRNVTAIVEAQLQIFKLNLSSRVMQMLSLSFDAALGEIFRAIAAGATLVLAPREELMPGPGLIEMLRNRGITAAAFPPALLGALPEEASSQLPALTTMVMGGEACPPQVARRWGESRLLLNGYGPTETTIGATLGTGWKLDEKPPLGRPLANVCVYVLNEHLQPLPVGVPGELYIGGVGVTRGYLNRPELTEEVFLDDPFAKAAGARMYRTGDRCRWLATGQLDYLGRRDAQVKIRGYRIEPGEVATVMQQHPGVGQCVVHVRKDRGVTRLVGYATANPETTEVTNSSLRAFAKDRLPEYMVPAVFMILPSIPTTPNGKTDYKALPRPDMNLLISEAEYVAPRNNLEFKLAGIWQQTLGLHQVSIHANFFELGGDSILSVQIVARATEAGITITVKDIFQRQTIAELATCATFGTVVSAEQGPVTGPVPLTPIQRWYFDQQPAEPAHFNHWMVLPTLHASLTPGRIEEVLTALCDHHDLLRARFKLQEGEWRQWLVDPGDTPPVARHDLSTTEVSFRQGTIDRCTEEAQTSLNLSEGPIFRVLAFDCGPREPGRLVLILHHLVTDIISWQILVQDFQSALQQVGKGTKPSFPPKTTSFQEWALQLSAYATSETLAAEHSYWLDPVRSHVGRFPVDQGTQSQSRQSSFIRKLSLSREDTLRLIQNVPIDQGITVQTVLVAALALTLSRWSGLSRILIDLEGHGREELAGASINLARTVGWFTSCYPAIIELEGMLDHPADALQSVARQIAAIPNKGIGYGVLRYLSTDAHLRDALAALPAAEVAFNYTGLGGRGEGRQVTAPPAEQTGGPLGQIALSQSDKRYRLHRFEIVAGVAMGALTVRWGYSRDNYADETIGFLCDTYLKTVRSLIDALSAEGAQDSRGMELAPLSSSVSWGCLP